VGYNPVMARTADDDIDPMLLSRWSPRAMSGVPLARQELRARQVPSRREPVAAFASEGRFA